MNLKQWISTNLIVKSGKLNIKRVEKEGKWIKNHYPEIYNEILYQTSNLTISHAKSYNSNKSTNILPEKLYWIMYDIEDVVICAYCNHNPVTFNSFERGYNIYCSTKCSRLATEKDRRQTCLEKYGYESPVQSPEIKKKVRNSGENVDIENKERKKRETNRRIRGVDHPTQCEEVKNKMKETSLRNGGYEYPSQSQIIKERQQSKIMENGGVLYPFQNSTIQNKLRNTFLHNGGVPHPMQNADFLESREPYKNCGHDYQLPSGKWIKLQGYESKAMDVLLEQYNEDDILHKISDMPEIGYRGNDNTWHRYYPDFHIPKDNLVVEVKSSYTYQANIKMNKLKENATRELGYEYKLLIGD